MVTLFSVKTYNLLLKIIEEPIIPEPIFIIEEPPGYDDVMEMDMEDLPSYTDVVKAEIHYFDDCDL